MGITKKIWMPVVSLILLVGIVIGFPSPAAEFYGRLTINDSDAYAGANISAYDPSGTLCGQFDVVNEGYFGLLSCNSDDTDTVADEGAENMENISFFVNGTRAVVFSNVSWVSGAFIYLNMTVKNYPPYFTHNFTNQSVGENENFYYEVNCTDLNIDDTLTFYDNMSAFNISQNGIINWNTTDSDVGNNTAEIICGDGSINTSALLVIEVANINNPPILQSIGNLIAVEGAEFSYNVTATDEDTQDILNYSSNSTLFTVDKLTGFFVFTPTIAQIGNYTINFSVTDGIENDSETILFTIVRGPYCGDLSCGNDEDCSSCPGDCGACPPAPPGSGSGESGSGSGSGQGSGSGTGSGVGSGTTGAGGSGTGGLSKRTTSICIERWECTEWEACLPAGTQIRKCLDVNKCGTKDKKPSELTNCVYVPTCFDGIQNGNELGIDCGGDCPACPILVSCFDGIQNQGEEGVDCGGPCSACEEKAFIEVPTPKLAPLVKQFPWYMLILVLVLLLSTVIGDRFYVTAIRRKEYGVYVKKLHKYRRYQRLIYEASAVISFISLVAIYYIYFMSDKPDLFMRFLWVPIAFVIVTLVGGFYLYRKFRFYEYKKRKEEQMFLLNHKKRQRDLIKIEDSVLTSMELNTIKKLEGLR